MGGKALCRGRVQAKNCETIHSHPCESGVVVSEAMATFSGCKFYGNLCGVATQYKGVLRMFECEVHDNNEGILVQSNGSAFIEKCKIRSNTANGIFAGFDHKGPAVLIENQVHINHPQGILIGSNSKVVSLDNVEYVYFGVHIHSLANINSQPALLSNKF